MSDTAQTTVSKTERLLREIVNVLTRRLRPTHTEVQTAIAAAREALAEYREEADDLRTSVVAFGAPWAVEHARAHGLPEGHLFPAHYDILAQAGARMVSFVRAEVSDAE